MEAAAGAEGAGPELLRDERQVRSELLEPADHDSLGGRVDRRRVVPTFAGAQHGLTLRPRGKVEQDALEILDAGAREREPVDHGSSGWNSRPETSFGKKYVLFGGIVMPWVVGAIADVSGMRWGLASATLCPVGMVIVLLWVRGRVRAGVPTPLPAVE